MTHAVDLFAGGGGWSVASREVGIHTTAIDNDEACVRTQRAAGFYAQCRDVRDVRPDGDWDAMIASPPCEKFSKQGKGDGRSLLDKIVDLAMEGSVDDLRRFAELETSYALVLEPLRLALESRFRWMVFEQVPSVAPVWGACAIRLRKEGYRSAVQLLRTETFGVAQTRTRAVLAATMERQGLLLPQMTHRRYTGHPRATGDRNLLPWTPMGQVLQRRGDWLFRGTRRARATTRGLHEPSPAIAIGHALNDLRWYHPGDTSFGVQKSARERDTSEQASLEELAALQGFLPDHPWSGLRPERYRQVGNAVPPPLGIAVLGSVERLYWEDVASSYLLRLESNKAPVATGVTSGAPG